MEYINIYTLCRMAILLFHSSNDNPLEINSSIVAIMGNVIVTNRRNYVRFMFQRDWSLDHCVLRIPDLLRNSSYEDARREFAVSFSNEVNRRRWNIDVGLLLTLFRGWRDDLSSDWMRYNDASNDPNRVYRLRSRDPRIAAIAPWRNHD